MTRSNRSTGIASAALSTAVVGIVFGLLGYFLMTDICLDAGGRVVNRGLGCEWADTRASFVLVPARTLVLFATLSGASWVACYFGIRRWMRRAAG